MKLTLKEPPALKKEILFTNKLWIQIILLIIYFKTKFKNISL